VVLTLGSVVLVVTAASETTQPTTAFAPNSPWNARVPPSPVLDPRSEEMVRYLSGEARAFADLYESGTPVWQAGPNDPRDRVRCTEPWGRCPLARESIRIPANAAPAPGEDGSMVVINGDTGYDFWRARRLSATSWSAGWGTRFSFAGNGAGGGATGSGVPLLAGLPRLGEIEHGQIRHALGFITANTCASRHRYPASKTDGWSHRPDCVPLGARIQLDPSIDVGSIPGITAGERIVARALQLYGAYCKNTGAARLAFGFQDPIGTRNPYPALGFRWDYYAMAHIPWSDLRVLRQWNGR
jgi:hypothetical protein